MFSNSRPVPSKAALKILYQLAYISSGTAVGVAALCAEERRRRTLLLQKIADNAKRIRQSPRYAHNRARNVVNADDASRSRGEAESHGACGLEHDERAARGPDLPSAVENGYTQLQERTSSTRRKRKRRRLSVGEVDYSVSHDEASAEQRPTRKIIHSSARLQRDGTISDQNFSVNMRGPKPAALGSSMASRAASGIPRGPADKAVDQDCQRSAVLRDIGLQDRRGSPDFGTLAAMWRSDSKQGSRLTAASTLGVGAVKDKVALFMNYVAQIDTASSSDCEAIAAWLLRLSASKGLLSEVRSLMSWLSAHDALSQDHILTLCESCSSLISRSDVDAAMIQDFYKSLFKMPEFTQQEADFQLKARLAVVVDFVRPGIFNRNFSIVRPLIPPIDQGMGNYDILKQYYEDLRAHGSIDHATNFLVAVCSQRKSHSLLSDREFLGLVDHCMVDAIKQRLLRSAISLWVLRSRSRIESIEDPEAYFQHLASQLDMISELAEYRQTTARLGTLCRTMDSARARGKPWYTNVLERIGVDTKTSLAVASSAMDGITPDLHRDLHQGLPQQMLRRVEQAQAARALKGVWHDTRRLPAVFAEYEKMRSSHARPSLESDELDHLGPAEMALIEICNLAQQPEKAIQIFKPGVDTGLRSSDSFTLAAFTLAQKQDWEAVGSLIDTAHRSQLSVGHDEVATRRLNAVAWLHTQQHNASQTWAFITSLIETVHFKLNVQTAKIMLWHLVSQSIVGQPTLIPAWIRFVKSQRVEFKIDPLMAAAMMHRFYLAQRVPHVMLMHLCRKLLVSMPQLQGPQWKALIKQAIGYDLRELDTRHVGEMQGAAAANLRNLTNSGESMPKPITSRSLRTQLVIHRSLAADLVGEQRQSGAERYPPAESLHKPNTCATSFEERHSLDHPRATNLLVGRDADLGVTKPPPTRSARVKEDSMDNGVGHAAGEDYNKIVEAFYARDEDAAQSAVDLPVPHLPKNDNAGHWDDILPTDVSHFDTQQYHEHKTDSDFEEDNDDVMLSEAFAEQQTVGYSGFHSTHRVRHLVADMIWNLSSKQYSKVLDLYESSLGTTGLPAAPLALAVAVQARIRLDGGAVREAMSMIEAARNAGYNVMCAMGPILIREMRLLRAQDKKNADKLRIEVINYYRSNAEAGMPVSHHVGVSAANVLIDNHCPEHGVNLLDSIYQAEWAKGCPPNIVAMAVYLKGYMALKSLRGILWVVRKALNDNMRITRRFLHRLQRSPKAFERNPQRYADRRNTVDPGTLRTLRRARAICAERRLIQRQQAARLGNKLVRAIGLSVRVQQASSDAEMQSLLNEGPLGHIMDVDRHGEVTWRTETPSSRPEAPTARSSPRSYLFRRRRAQLMLAAQVKSRKLARNKSSARTRGEAYGQLRLQQYHAFRKERRVDSRGLLMSFHSYLAQKTGKAKSRSMQPRAPRNGKAQFETTSVPFQHRAKTAHGESPSLGPLQKLQTGETTEPGKYVDLSPSLYSPLKSHEEHPASEEQRLWQGSGRLKLSHDRSRTSGDNIAVRPLVWGAV